MMTVPCIFDARRLLLFVALAATAARSVHGRVRAPLGRAPCDDHFDYPLVASVSFLGGTADADAALSGIDLDSLDSRGERGVGPGRNGGGIIRRFLLHGDDDLSSMEEAIERAKVGGAAWVVDEERTERMRAVVADDAESSEREHGDDRELLGAEGYQTIDGFPCYRTVDGTIQTMMDIAVAHPHLATIEKIGESHQKRDIFVLKLTDKSSPAEKAPLFITAGIHAREYAPPELAIRFAEHLVENYGVSADIDGILAHTEIAITAVSNPDGRIIAQNFRNLWWRKNANEENECKEERGNYGVDLNRNFNFMWGGAGASTDPCGASYRGASAGSESETAAIMKYSESIFPPEQRKGNPVKDVDAPYDELTSKGMYVDVHSFGEDIIFPWGHKDKKAGNFQAYQAISHKLCSINGHLPSGSGGYRFLGTVSGDTLDYHYGELGVCSILFELGTEFYQNCDDFENKILPDNLKALLYASKLVHRPYELAKGPDVTRLTVPDATAASSSTVEVKARVSDREMTQLPNNSDDLPPETLSTGNQRIVSVKLFVGGHPYDPSPPEPLDMSPAGGVGGEASFASHTVDAALTLDVSDLTGMGPQIMVCAVGTDAMGFDGPVSCEYLTIAPRTTAAASPPPPAVDEGSAAQQQTTPASAGKPQSTTTATTPESPTITTSLQQTPTPAAATPQSTTTKATTTVTQNDIGGGVQTCSDQSIEGDCNEMAGCKWKKDKCQDVCAGKNKRDKCHKVGGCAWDGKSKICLRSPP